MTRSASLRAVLVTALARQGVDASALPIAISDDLVGRVWNAFRAFAAEPVQDLYPDLTIPGPGRRDTDRLGFEFTPGRPATRNSGPRPPSAWLVREVYLVDANGEWQRSDDTAVRLDLEGRPSWTAVNPVYGAGGPETAAIWAKQVEESALWSRISASGVVGVELE
jgi:hypothetical protein